MLRIRCSASLNMTAPFMKPALMLLRDVGVHFLVIPAGIFFLSFSKRYVVGDTANAGVRLGIIFGYLERDTHWPGGNATRPIKLDLSCANILFGFLYGISRIPSWIRGNAKSSEKGQYEKVRDLHLREIKITRRERKRDFLTQLIRDLIRSLPVRSASGLPVHLTASQALDSRLRSE
jgi:hypothetical protein